ncbi:hypothetical protein AAF712_012246 [Marasmius tenuissimus]|uniref:Uncharacterized protein n=1 Tax=Marasmius tenuissimus TaxID=585030 RepID=A0ABR2ZI94_9AGAR
MGNIVEALSKKAYSNETKAAFAGPTEEELADPLVHLRKFIVTVCLSTLKHRAFAELQQLLFGVEFGITKDEHGEIHGALILMLDVITQWSSTYFMLRCAIQLHKAIDMMMVHANLSELAKYQLSQDGWKHIEFLALILKKANMCQQMLSTNSYLSLPMSISALKHLQSSWEALQDQCWDQGNNKTAEVLQKGLNKLAKYYKLQEKSEAYETHSILDFKKWWTNLVLDKDSGQLIMLAEQAEQEFIKTCGCK